MGLDDIQKKFNERMKARCNRSENYNKVKNSLPKLKVKRVRVIKGDE